jgi:hypothetical protein
VPLVPCDLRRDQDSLAILKDYIRVLRLENVYLDLVCKVTKAGDFGYILSLDNDLNELKDLI